MSPRLRALALLALFGPLACTPAAFAADPAAPVTRSQNVTINLIRRLVQRGVLPQSDADELIKMAEEDAALARTEAAVAPAPAPTVAATPAPAPDDTVRVTYVPEFLKKQIREEVKQDVLNQAREERWANPRAMPDWLSRYTFFGDLRLRSEWVLYPSGNNNTGAFPNFNTINTGAPFDVTGSVFSPQINVDQNRQRERLRVRFGADVDMGEGFTAGLRIGTGQDNSPVTLNQTLGQNGAFTKYALWLDRGFVAYHTGEDKDAASSTFYVGRFDNPFVTTTMLFDENVGFDGVAGKTKFTFNDTLKPFATLGAFPIFNSNLNFSSIQPAKFKSQNKFLFAGQIGTEVKIKPELNGRLVGGFFYFDNVEGRLSSPFTPITSSDNGDTDETRPAFAQMGNTYFPLRNIIPNALNNFGTINQFQYFGLATPYHEVMANGRLDYDHFQPMRISLSAEWVNNIAFHRGDIARKAVNNLGPGGTGDFVGGNNGYNVELRAGSVALTKRWDWSTWVSYRYLESDATVDGLVDSDFALGSTNISGYTLGAQLALSKRTWLTLRWLSATSISGPQFKNDIIQFDFNGKF